MTKKPKGKHRRPPNKRLKQRRGRPKPGKDGPPRGGKKRSEEERPLPGFFKPALAATEEQLAAWKRDSEELRANPYQEPANIVDSLDEWQKQAYDGLVAGKNVVVDAPTTAGKTRIVEAYFTTFLKQTGFRAAYTTPVKSLSNDKVREMREMFGADNVGIATGDIKENINAPIVVTTLETYRNSLLGLEPDLNRNLVIFDEYHFMQDESRGSAWEEAIILTPDNCQLLLLSASVENGTDFCKWLETIHNKTCEFIVTKHRPVPLADLIYWRGEWILRDEIPAHLLKKSKGHTDKRGHPQPLPHPELTKRLVGLIEKELVPCIIYAGRRRTCQNLAYEIGKALPPLEEEQRRAIGEALQEIHAENKALSLLDPSLRNLIQTYGVTFHHSGLAPAVRVAIEALLKRGLLRFCTATMGLSIGINFSVRSALISDYQRPGETGFTRYSPSEVLQMVGRAGRRGRDVVGYSLWPNQESFLWLGRAERDDCESRLKNDPTTYLGLVARGYEPSDIENFYSKSFRRFGDKGVDLSLLTAKRLRSKLGASKLPCTSPASAISTFHSEEKNSAPCMGCPHRKDCHRYIKIKSKGDLTALQLHLHKIGALDAEEKLTPYGEIAKFFPQTGGLVLADLLAHNAEEPFDISEYAQLMATISMARFKSPGGGRYEHPFDPEAIEEALEEFYPYRLFPELYDPPFGRRNYPVIREFNPDAGFAIKAWLKGSSWEQLNRNVTNEKFATGDLMSMMYRIATYLQSLSQARIPELSEYARATREEILREPLSVTI